MALYQDLDESRSEIRLLEILSDAPDDMLECKLHTTSVDYRPQFTALSYVWGDPEDTEDILVNGSTTSITSNLASALRHVRRHWHAVFPLQEFSRFRIWADALCINQKDLSERRSQVQLMRRIYSGAEMVISWLGSGLTDINLALQILSTITEQTKSQAPKDEDFSMEWLYQYPKWFEDDAMWNALKRFSQLRYWKRIWIFQELILGRNVHLVHGTTTYHLDQMISGAVWLHRLRGAYNGGFLAQIPTHMEKLTTMEGWYELLKVIEIRERVEVHGPIPPSEFKEVLGFLLSEFAATDPRDHVYGLLGLLKTDIVPDYTRPVAEVYRHFFDLYIKSTKSLVFMHIAGVGVYEDRVADLPSWVPNFTQRAKADELDQRIDSWPDAVWGRADQGIFDTIQRFSHLPKMHEAQVQTTALICAEIVDIQPQFSKRSVQDNSLYTFVCDLVEANKDHPLGSFRPFGQVFWALRPVNIAAPLTVSLRQAVVFLAFVLNCPGIEHTNPIDELVSRATRLGISLSEKVEAIDSLAQKLAPAILEQINFPQDIEYLELVIRILVHEDQLRNPNMLDLQHMFDTQVLFRLSTLNFEHRVALVPQFAQAGDVIAILKGCDAPMVLRAQKDHYAVVGASFSYGLMYGELGSPDYTGDEWFFEVVDLA